MLWTTAIALSLVCAVVSVRLCFPSRPWPPKPLDTAFYVWQNQWNDGVRSAVERAAKTTHHFMVSLGEVSVSANGFTFNAAQPDWKVLAESQVKTTIVLRVGVGLNKLLTADSFEKSHRYLASLLNDILATAKQNGAALTGIQMDYDSPTSGLAAYRRLMNALRGDIPGVEWSVTALPTWTKDPDFPALVKDLSYYVLQVHSLEPPTSIDKPIVLFDPSKTEGYLRRAASIGVPFYVALPTYGYQVAFDEKGHFIALSAEGPSHAWKPGVQVRTAMSDPAAIAKTVQQLGASTPPPCIGIAWFRLPVESDELNWSWSTLEVVRQGRAPRVAYTAEIRNPSPNLYEIWISNTGESNVAQKIQFDVHWQDTRPQVHDLVNEFQAVKGGPESALRLAGPAPRQGKPLMVGWFRFAPRDSEVKPPLRSGDVAVTP
ncbi:MAG: DUF3142 domain-containing protein [Candidatus Hydrogenedentes bacterium]|nr:DUF3142 domain-containing protein [Candidatus Hydrogenedentota bacterium]